MIKEIASGRRLTPEEAERAMALICTPVCDMPICPEPGAYQEKCEFCPRMVWICATAPKAPTRVCLVCARGTALTKH